VEVKTDANREAINAVGEKLAGFQAETRERFEAVEQKIDDHHQEATGRFRSVDEQLAEIKDLIVGPARPPRSVALSARGAVYWPSH